MGGELGGNRHTHAEMTHLQLNAFSTGRQKKLLSSRSSGSLWSTLPGVAALAHDQHSRRTMGRRGKNPPQPKQRQSAPT